MDLDISSQANVAHQVHITISGATSKNLDGKSLFAIKEKLYAASQAKKDTDLLRHWNKVKDNMLITQSSFVKSVTLTFKTQGKVVPKADVTIAGAVLNISYDYCNPFVDTHTGKGGKLSDTSTWTDDYTYVAHYKDATVPFAVIGQKIRSLV